MKWNEIQKIRTVRSIQQPLGRSWEESTRQKQCNESTITKLFYIKNLSMNLKKKH